MSDGLTLEKLKIEERLRSVEMQTARLLSHWMSEFGGGNTPGNINVTLNKIEELIKEQNGRVKKLEEWKVYILGGICAISIIFSLIIAILTLIKK